MTDGYRSSTPWKPDHREFGAFPDDLTELNGAIGRLTYGEQFVGSASLQFAWVAHRVAGRL